MRLRMWFAVAGIMIVGSSYCLSPTLAQETATQQQPEAATAGPQPKDFLRIIKPGAELHLPDKSIVNLPRGIRVQVSKVRGEWIGGYAHLDDQKIAGWVLLKDLAPAPNAVVIEDAMAKLAALGFSFERDVHGVPITAAGEGATLAGEEFQLFTPLVDLIEIDLSKTKITDADLDTIAALTGLERLYLDETSISDEGLAKLAALEHLTGLSLSKTAITDKGLAALSGMSHLKTLNLADTEISDAGLAALEKLNGIETLTLSRTKVLGPGLAAFADFQDLITLNLNGCQLESGGLAHFKNLKKIRILHLYDTTAPAADIDELEAAVKGLAIFH